MGEEGAGGDIIGVGSEGVASVRMFTGNDVCEDKDKGWEMGRRMEEVYELSVCNEMWESLGWVGWRAWMN